MENYYLENLQLYYHGRYVSFRMMPFTFKEMCALNNIEDKKEEEFLKYVEWGGMPAIFTLNSDQERSTYLQDIYSGIVLKDIVARYKIKDVDLLNKIIQFMMENIGGIFSANSIKKYLKQEGIYIAPNTIYNYVEYINNSLLLDKVSRYAIKGKNVLATLEKYYLVDMGILQSKKSTIEKKIGGRLENIVYNELIARGYKVNIGKTEKGEIDFVVDNFGEIIYIQVADYLSSEEVVKREFGAFDEVKDNFPKYVLTMDKIDYSMKGIKHMNIIDFLLQE
jgi:predicted AAA+ superfamily ATPase